MEFSYKMEKGCKMRLKMMTRLKNSEKTMRNLTIDGRIDKYLGVFNYM